MNTIPFNKKGVMVVAHRGVSKLECENTCAAFIAAGNRSYFGVETDVRTTADGHFIILHDETTERVAGIPKTAAIWMTCFPMRPSGPVRSRTSSTA